MVERAYEQYLVDECKNQIAHKRKLEAEASTAAASSQQQQQNAGGTADSSDDHATDKAKQLLEQANAFQLSRCTELEDLFPRRKQRGGGSGGYYRTF